MARPANSATVIGASAEASPKRMVTTPKTAAARTAHPAPAAADRERPPSSAGSREVSAPPTTASGSATQTALDTDWPMIRTKTTVKALEMDPRGETTDSWPRLSAVSHARKAATSKTPPRAAKPAARHSSPPDGKSPMIAATAATASTATTLIQRTPAITEAARATGIIR